LDQRLCCFSQSKDNPKTKVLQEPSNKEDHNPIDQRIAVAGTLTRCGRNSVTLLQCADNVLQAPVAVGASRSMINASLTCFFFFKKRRRIHLSLALRFMISAYQRENKPHHQQVTSKIK
jgi:hypothetical protein